MLLAASGPQFTDVTAELHLTFQHHNSPTSQKYLVETMGPGAALFDFDNDGRLDVFFTNGARLADPMRPGEKPDKSDPRYWNRLFHQNANGSFSDVTERAGVSGSAEHCYSMGVATGDYDNDGYTDLYVTGAGCSALYHNNGDGTFANVTARAGVVASGWSTSAVFFDYDNDGKLDLFVARYVEWSFDKNPFCGDPKPGGRAYCHPDKFAPVTSLLFHNNGDGTFTDASEQTRIAASPGKALGVAIADYDNDGWPDLYVANDSTQCRLFHNNSGRDFTDVSLQAGVGFNEDGKTFAGMGADFADYDNDGLPDIFVTDLSGEIYRLFRNNGDGTFTDTAIRSGLSASTMPFSGWGTKFVDIDNDGWKDLFVAQGHVLDTIERSSPGVKYREPPLLLRNSGGVFTRSIAGDAFRVPWAGRGAAFGDIDNDGDIDVIVANCGEPAYILRNDAGNRNNWLSIRLRGTKSNRDGIGARITVADSSRHLQYVTVTTSSSYMSASDGRVLAGLGQNPSAARITVKWPSGGVQVLENVKTNQFLTITEPAK